MLKNWIKYFFFKCGYTIIPNSALPFYFSKKYRTEISFWKSMYTEFVRWYNGDLKELYQEPSPLEEQKIKIFNSPINAILTWQDIHQKVKYRQDLLLNTNKFEGLNLLDIGSGPFPSALVFEKCELFCLDPLLPLYIEVGYPIHVYEPRVHFVYGFSEKMPFEDNFFDAIISVNALDHVDDFALTSIEIKRVLKPEGKVRFHLHYHLKTITEPLELNDAIVKETFSWCTGFKKIHESKMKRGYSATDKNELFTIWSNF